MTVQHINSIMNIICINPQGVIPVILFPVTRGPTTIAGHPSTPQSDRSGKHVAQVAGVIPAWPPSLLLRRRVEPLRTAGVAALPGSEGPLAVAV